MITKEQIKLSNKSIYDSITKEMLDEFIDDIIDSSSINELKVVAISDLHGHLPDYIEESDLMLLAGDISPISIQGNKKLMWEWFSGEFRKWVELLPVDKVIMIAGNHDFIEHWKAKDKLAFQRLFNGKLRYLCNEEYVYMHNGVHWKIFGTPYCNIYGNWPFMRTDEQLNVKFREMPEDVDIIISHSPPFAVGDIDICMEDNIYKSGYGHIGNRILKKWIFDNMNFKLLVCGHIHSGDHNPVEFNNGICVNVSLLGEDYKIRYKPFYCKLSK